MIYSKSSEANMSLRKQNVCKKKGHPDRPIPIKMQGSESLVARYQSHSPQIGPYAALTRRERYERQEPLLAETNILQPKHLM